MTQDLERKQSLAKKQDRNSNDEDRAPPSLEDLKRRGIFFPTKFNTIFSPDPSTNFETITLESSQFFLTNQIVSGKKK